MSLTLFEEIAGGPIMGIMAVNTGHSPGYHPFMHAGGLTAFLVTFAADFRFITLK